MKNINNKISFEEKWNKITKRLENFTLPFLIGLFSILLVVQLFLVTDNGRKILGIENIYGEKMDLSSLVVEEASSLWENNQLFGTITLISDIKTDKLHLFINKENVGDFKEGVIVSEVKPNDIVEIEGKNQDFPVKCKLYRKSSNIKNQCLSEVNVENNRLLMGIIKFK